MYFFFRVPLIFRRCYFAERAHTNVEIKKRKKTEKTEIITDSPRDVKSGAERNGPAVGGHVVMDFRYNTINNVPDGIIFERFCSFPASAFSREPSTTRAAEKQTRPGKRFPFGHGDCTTRSNTGCRWSSRGNGNVSKTDYTGERKKHYVLDS